MSNTYTSNGNPTEEADAILRSLHFDVFNAMEKIGDSRKRAFQKHLKALRIIEHAVKHVTGETFTGFPLNCGLAK